MINKKVILCGYNWAGCKALHLLLNRGYKVFVYTSKSPDYINDLIAYCQEMRVEYSTEKIQIDNLPFKPLFIASVFYRYIIPASVIEYVEGKIFNLHPSLLPAYRGCSSLTWAMINGEEECGYTYHFIDEGIDTGNIILQKKINIEDFDTQVTLYHRVMFEALKDFNEVVNFVLSGKKGIPQNQDGISFYQRGCPFDGKIKSDWSLEQKKRFVRAMIYPPLPAAIYENSSSAKLEDFYHS